MRYLIGSVLFALVGAVAGCAGQTPPPCTPPTTSGEQSKCACDCRTLHDCCMKSCNWAQMPYAADSVAKGEGDHGHHGQHGVLERVIAQSTVGAQPLGLGRQDIVLRQHLHHAAAHDQDVLAREDNGHGDRGQDQVPEKIQNVFFAAESEHTAAIGLGVTSEGEYVGM